MNAVVLRQIGYIEDLEKNLIIEERPEPEFSDDEVLIKIKYAALNRRDLWITKGLYAGIKTPIVMGSDCSGIIYKKGKNVKGFNEGDEVFVYPVKNWGDNESFQGKDFQILGLPEEGTLREYMAVHKSVLFKYPSNLNPMEASTVPLAGLTAFRAEFIKADINENDNILITGIGGGVSTFALIFATAINANVFVTSGSNNKIENAINLGAKGGVNYNIENWDKKLIEISGNCINKVIDGTGGDAFNRCTNVLTPGGTLVNYGVTIGAVKDFELRRVFWKQLNILGSSMGTYNDFKQMINFIEEKKIKPVIDKVYKMEESFKAFQRMNNSEQFGKIVIEMG